MFFFVLVFFILVLLSFIEQFTYNNKVILNACSLVFVLFLIVLTTIRGNNAADYDNYKTVFDWMTDLSDFFSPLNFEYEPLWSIVRWICKRIYDNFHFHLFVIGSFCIIVEYICAKNYSLNRLDEMSFENVKIKKGVNSGEFFFTYFAILWGLYYANIYVIRSTVALMITFYFSTKYIEEKRFVKFLISVIAASGFHYSALVFLPAYFIYYYHCSLKRKMLIVGVASFVMAMQINRIGLFVGKVFGGRIGNKISAYLEGESFLYGTGMSESAATFVLLKTLANIGVLVIAGIYLWRFNKNNKKYEGLLNLYLFGSILYTATLTVGRAFGRMSVFYNVYQIPMILYFLSKVNPTKKNRSVYWFICMGYVSVRLIVNYSVPFIPFWRNE